MKKKFFICGMSVLMIGMVSCKTVQKEVKADDTVVAIGDNSRNALDWDGHYSGVLPCDDDGGVQITIELSADNTFKMKQSRLGAEDMSVESFGDIVWSKEGNIITLGEGKDLKKILVGENSLIVLDKEGKRIMGESAGKYILAKADMSLVEKYWRLTELFGEPVVTPEGGKEAHIILKVEGNRVVGTGGCNNFSGAYTLQPGNIIRFSQMISTMMMCASMDVETKMKQVLEMADNYNLNGDKLVLNKARMAPLARFEAVSMN